MQANAMRILRTKRYFSSKNDGMCIVKMEESLLLLAGSRETKDGFEKILHHN